MSLRSKIKFNILETKVQLNPKLNQKHKGSSPFKPKIESLNFIIDVRHLFRVKNFKE